MIDQTELVRVQIALINNLEHQIEVLHNQISTITVLSYLYVISSIVVSLIFFYN